MHTPERFIAHSEDFDFRREIYARYVSLQAASGRAPAQVDQRRYLALLDGLSPNSLILELGCGQGYLLDFLRAKGFTRIKGIDISGEQVLCAQHKGLNVEQADVFEALENMRGVCDAIVAIDFIEHFMQSRH